MKTLENQLKLFLRFFTFIGQFPFKITDKELVPSTQLKIYGIVQIIILGSVVSATVIADIKLVKLREDAIRLICYVLINITIAATMIVSISKSSRYCSMFQIFNKVELQFQYLGISTKEQNNSYPPLQFLLKELSIMAIMVALEYISPYWINNVSFYSAMYYWLAMLIILSFGSVNCRVYAYLISARYELINRKLESIGANMETNTLFAMKNKITDDLEDNLFGNTRKNNIIIQYRLHTTQKKDAEITNSVTLLQECHYDLYGICNILIEIFSYPIIFFVFVMALSLLFACFTGLDKILYSPNVNVLEILNSLKYSAYYLYRIAYILKAFTYIEKTGNATTYYVQGLLLKARDPELRKELKHFSQQLHHHKLYFSTSGFFSLDMSLLVSMAGAITTYLVILLEFPGAKNKNPEVAMHATEL